MQVSGIRTAAHYGATWDVISLLSSSMIGWLDLRPIRKTKVWDLFTVDGWGLSACGNVATKGNVSATVFVGHDVINGLVLDRSIQSVVDLVDTCELSSNANAWYPNVPTAFDRETYYVNATSGSTYIDSCCLGQTFVQGPVRRYPTIGISGPFDEFRAFLSSDWFHGYRGYLRSDWISGSRVFLDAYKRALYKQFENSCCCFAQLCGRAVHLALLLGRQIEIAFHMRLIQPRILQTLVGA